MTTSPTVLAYGLKDAAAVTGFSKTHLMQAIHKGELPAKRSGRDDEGNPAGKWVVMAADLEAYLESLPDG